MTRKHKKEDTIGRKIKGIYLQKLLICLRPTIVDSKPWYQIQVEALHFDQND